MIALLSGWVQLFTPVMAQGDDRLDSSDVWSNRVSIGLNFGPTLYFGNIRTNPVLPVFNPYSEVKFGYGILVSKSINRYSEIDFEFLKGQIAGLEKTFSNGDSANRYFEGDYLSISLLPVINFSNLFSGQDSYRRIYFKGFAGGGIVLYRARLKNYKTGDYLGLVGYSDDGMTRLHPTSAFVVPMGLKIQYKLTSRLSLNSEINYHLVMAGNLDAMKGPNSNDGLLYTAFGATFHFLKSSKKKQVSKLQRQIKPEQLAMEKAEEPLKGFGFLPLTPKQAAEQAPLPPSDDLEYRVQIMATYMQRIPLNDFVIRYQLTQAVKEYYNNGWYQYSVGSFPKMEDAVHYKNKLSVEDELNDAFVVVFKNGSRFYQGKRKLVSFNIIGDEPVTFPKPEISEEQEFENVEFRIQIAAITGKKISIGALKEKYELKDETIHSDSLNGRYYYTVGSFRNLRQAREYCKILISRNLIYDAFVISYVDGVRKTLSQITTKASNDGNRKIESKEGYVFKVQLLVSIKDLPVATFKEHYGLREQVTEEKQNNLNVYTCGQFKAYEQALDYQGVCRKAGIADAFVVAYQDKKKVPLKEALTQY